MGFLRLLRAIGSKVLERLGVLLVIAIILFFMFRLMPGNPLVAFISPTFTTEQQQTLMTEFGLDKPLGTQFVIYIGQILHGNLGESFFFKRPVAEVLGELLPNTLMLSLFSLVLAYIFGTIAGAILAWRRGSAARKLQASSIRWSRARRPSSGSGCSC